MSPSSPHRVSELLGCSVMTKGGKALGVVKDVRLAPTAAMAGARAELIVAGLVVGQRHTGAFLGYDRQQKQGPWLVRAIVRRIQRESGYLQWTAITEADWSNRRLYSVTDELEPLTHALEVAP